MMSGRVLFSKSGKRNILQAPLSLGRGKETERGVTKPCVTGSVTSILFISFLLNLQDRVSVF